MEKNKNEFLELLESNQNIVIKICNIYCDNAEDRKDMFQEIIFQLWKSFSTFEGKSSFSTWLYRVALNTALYFHRRSKRSLSENDMDELYKRNFMKEWPEKEVEHLYKAIYSLNKIDKALILLYLEKNSYKQMSEILGMSTGNISVKLVRAKKRLKDIYNSTKEGDTDGR